VERGRERSGFAFKVKVMERGVGDATMWIGIFVLLTFGAASVSCLFLAVRAFQQGKWHVVGALLVPGFGIGGVIIMLIYKPIMLDLFGDPNLQDVPETAQRLTGDELIAMHSDVARFGIKYNEDTELFRWYDETVTADGGFKGQDENGATWSGGWDPVEDQVCYTTGQNTECYDSYRDGDNFYETNYRDEIVRSYTLLGPVMSPAEGSVALQGIPLMALIPGHTLIGDLKIHNGNPFFSAGFAADSDAVTVMRGPSADDLSQEEAGTYMVDEDGNLCLMGVLNVTDECFAVMAKPGGLDLVRTRGNRVVAAIDEIN